MHFNEANSEEAQKPSATLHVIDITAVVATDGTNIYIHN